MVRDPVSREHDGIDGQLAQLTLRPPKENLVHPITTVDAGDRRPGQYGHSKSEPGDEIEEADRLRMRIISDEGDRAHTGLAQGQHSGIRDVLGAYDQRAATDRKGFVMYPLL